VEGGIRKKKKLGGLKIPKFPPKKKQGQSVVRLCVEVWGGAVKRAKGTQGGFSQRHFRKQISRGEKNFEPLSKIRPLGC